MRTGQRPDERSLLPSRGCAYGRKSAENAGLVFVSPPNEPEDPIQRQPAIFERLLLSAHPHVRTERPRVPSCRCSRTRSSRCCAFSVVPQCCHSLFCSTPSGCYFAREKFLTHIQVLAATSGLIRLLSAWGQCLKLFQFFGGAPPRPLRQTHCGVIYMIRRRRVNACRDLPSASS